VKQQEYIGVEVELHSTQDDTFYYYKKQKPRLGKDFTDIYKLRCQWLKTMTK